MAHALLRLVVRPGGRAQSSAAPDASSVVAARPLAAPSASVSDEQILAFVVAAQALGRRRRDRSVGISSEAADERLERLDWAVRAGLLELTSRGARGTARVPAARGLSPRNSG